MFDYLTRITLCRESGLYEQWIQNILNYNRRRLRSIDSNAKNMQIIYEFNVLTLNNLYDLFYLVIYGSVLSFTIFISEIFSLLICFRFILTENNN